MAGTLAGSHGGATEEDPSRDNWRTPFWIVEQIRKWHPTEKIFDVACGVEDRLFDDGAKGRNMLAEAWPDDAVLFLNPTFSNLMQWASKVRAEYEKPRKFTLYLITPFRPETGWWDALFYDAMFTDLWCPRVSGRLVLGWQTEEADDQIMHGVFKDRVAFDPPPGVKKSGPGGWTALSKFRRRAP